LVKMEENRKNMKKHKLSHMLMGVMIR